MIQTNSRLSMAFDPFKEERNTICTARKEIIWDCVRKTA